MVPGGHSLPSCPPCVCLELRPGVGTGYTYWAGSTGCFERTHSWRVKTIVVNFSGSDNEKLGVYKDMRVWSGRTNFGFDCTEGNHKICYEGGNRIGQGVRTFKYYNAINVGQICLISLKL